MSDSNKRERLVQAATNLFHHRGYAKVSLSDVARESGVLQGNIYYYFKTKRLLAIAVLEAWQDKVSTLLTSLEEHNPRERVIAFLEMTSSIAEVYTEWGCPIANLSHDLLSEIGEHLSPAPCVYQVHLTWLQTQFEAIGYSATEAQIQSQQLLSELQGGIHLAHVMGRREILETLLTSYCDKIRALP